MSLVKYLGNSGSPENPRGKTFWGRADIDGYPFRSPNPLSYTEEEFQAKAVRVADAKNGFFDLSDPDQNTRYLEVIDRHANGWYKLIWREHHYDEANQKMRVYVEWLEFFMEDGTQMPVRGTEASNGSENLPRHSPPGP